MAAETLIKAQGLTKIYKRGSEEVTALDGVSLEVERGDFLAFIGPSGSGKTTLVNILGCLDNPTSGTLTVCGETMFAPGVRLSESRLTCIRREVFGYVFQKFYLVPTLTVAENVTLPFAFFRKPGHLEDPAETLKFLGIENRRGHRPSELSGGEMQRVAIARALMNNPEVILADEPTGNLDTARSWEIGQTLKMLNEKSGLTILLVTHNPDLAGVAHKVIELRDGKISSKAPLPKPPARCRLPIRRTV